METMERSKHYPKSYGAWAGNPKGQEPDYSRCCKEVWSSERWSRAYQCQRQRGHGPDEAYCKQHVPDAAKARQEAAATRWRDKYNAERYQTHGRTFYNALVKIAEGYNDARGLAEETIAKFKDGEHR
jgi:hypothetical protein